MVGGAPTPFPSRDLFLRDVTETSRISDRTAWSLWTGEAVSLNKEVEPGEGPDSRLPHSLQVRLMQESVRRIIEAEESRMGEKARPLLGQGGRGGSQRSTPLLQPSCGCQPAPPPHAL